MFLHIKEAKYLKDYEIELTFNDGKRGIVDLKDELYGSVFEVLKDKNLFANLKVDRDLDTITWSNGADFAPEFLYYKAFKNDKTLKKLFEKWGYNKD